MDKQLIEKIALEVANSLSAPYVSDESAVRFATRFLSRIDAERGKEAVAWLHESRREADVITTSVKHVWGRVAVGSLVAYSIPLFLSPTPTIPEGMVLVPIEPTTAICAVISNEHDIYGSAQELYAMVIAAAQGERK